jgi:hypothetical protein
VSEYERMKAEYERLRKLEQDKVTYSVAEHWKALMREKEAQHAAAEAVAKACADISAYGYRVCAICHATGGKHVDCPLPAYLATVGR